jgi:hypothetical protein
MVAKWSRIFAFGSIVSLMAVSLWLVSGCAGTKSAQCGGIGCAAVAVANGEQYAANSAPAANNNVVVVNAPAWLRSGGNTVSYPNEIFLTGVAAVKGEDALKRALTDAAADLANRITVRIESELTDVNSEKNGKVDYHIAAMTRLTSDTHIQGLKYEIAYVGADVYALAYVKRSEVAAEHRMQLNRVLLALRTCLNSARALRTSASASVASGYQQCLQYVTEGLQHDAVMRNSEPQNGLHKPPAELVQGLQEIRDATASITARPATSIKEAADFLALQLGARGNIPYVFRDAPAFRYGVTNFASSLGQQLSLSLESALAQRRSGGESRVSGTPDAVVRGVYFEEADNIRIAATIVEIGTGKVVGGAETIIAKSNLPAGVAIRPKNLESALAEQRLLAEGELIEGTLRVEVWTDKGRRGVVYAESEPIRLFMRVNAPAYVRLIYVLQSGIQVPIDQGYYIDSSKVNMAVEYPDRFEAAPPFGVEHIHATAFTKQPAPLPVASQTIDGQNYTIVQDGLSSVVRHRGIKRVEKDEVAESLISITTFPATAR